MVSITRVDFGEGKERVKTGEDVAEVAARDDEIHSPREGIRLHDGGDSFSPIKPKRGDVATPWMVATNTVSWFCAAEKGNFSAVSRG
ncbi:MAG: hypothetical protein NVSMB1_05660 [Polyangiales bacterium]